MNRLARVSLLGLAALLLAACSENYGVEETTGAGTPDSGSQDEEVCIQVVVWARPPAGGACQEYSTPCKVPDGYVQCCGGKMGGCYGPLPVECVDDPTDACDPQTHAGCQSICQ